MLSGGEIGSALFLNLFMERLVPGEEGDGDCIV